MFLPIPTANKYIRAEHLSLMDSICRINPHSISKKASRLSQVIKHETGILPKVSCWSSIKKNNNFAMHTASKTIMNSINGIRIHCVEATNSKSQYVLE